MEHLWTLAREDFEEVRVVVGRYVGVSRDDTASHAKFREHHRLPFTLLSDPDGKIASSWGVRNVLGFIPARVTFVFDKQGVVRHRFESNMRFGKHVDEALQIVKTLR